MLPFLLVPAPSADPRPGRYVSSRRAHHRHHLFPVLRPGEVQVEPGIAQSHEVTVTLDESGNRQLPAQIDPLSLGPGQGFNFGVVSHRLDPVTPYRHRLGGRLSVVFGDETPVEE